MKNEEFSEGARAATFVSSFLILNSAFPFGCQYRSSSTSAPIEQSAATMSTSHGPWKLEIRNCGTANAAPAVSAAGHTPNIPRQPANAHTTQKGTISEKNGS